MDVQKLDIDGKQCINVANSYIIFLYSIGKMAKKQLNYIFDWTIDSIKSNDSICEIKVKFGESLIDYKTYISKD